jgi:Rps23 Pro-64 3,4-dihydroxylase Tpa1-like proline 4-hydroxylase
MIFTRDLKEVLQEVKQEFDSNTPFPYIAITGLFNEEVLRLAREEIADAKGSKKSYQDSNQIKRGIEGRELLTSSPPNIQKVFRALNSPEFLDFLQELTEIEDLFADDTFRGGGVHHIPTGGKLGVHIDFSRPKWDRSVFRRANALLYLNEDWDENWNGHLELWDDSVKNGGRCVKKIAPNFNTLVIFGTKKESWHGHPTPLQCPRDRARQSFASYYYSKSPSDDLQEHSTIFS